MKNTLQQYQRPEVVRLGPASAMTLGTIGCDPDGHCCQKAVAEQ